MLTGTAVLEVDRIGIAFGGIHALNQVSFQVGRGEILGIIGPNGAGKSTLFSVISGFLRPNQGRILFDGSDVDRFQADKRARLGLVRTWQIPRAFSSLTVKENITVAAISHAGSIRSAAGFVGALLEETGLAEQAGEVAGDLPPAFRKRLEVARALARSPRVLLLDEVMAGLTSREMNALFALLRNRVARDGMTIVLIEHVIRAVRTLCGRVVVLSGGNVIAEGPPANVLESREVIQAYLGTAEYLHGKTS
ncbi:MAG: ABC transporter ATP-binding protein [Proteobacteria bacterium]|nr:ABC transporter ATP-binding protein [Pseudomonadota bacterium]